MAEARRRICEAYPEDWPIQLRIPFQKTWDRMESNARVPRATGRLTAEIVDDFDVLGVNDFHPLFDYFFDVLFPPDGRATEETRKQEKQVILAYAKEIRDLRDPMSHPSAMDMPLRDAVRLLDTANRVLVKLDQHAVGLVADAVGELMSAGGSDDEESSFSPEPLDGYVPAADTIVVSFIGREEQLKELRTWLGSREQRWILEGDGGKGKTAIAYAFACEVREMAPEPFTFVIWMSAKRRRFEEGTVASVGAPDFFDLRSGLDWILRYSGDWAEGKQLEEEVAKELCLELLNEFPTLLIVDDIDSLPDDDEAIPFFTLQAPTTKSKVLLTSRRALYGLGRTTTLVQGFNDFEGIRFINQRLQQFGLDPREFRDSTKAAILDATDRSPLFIEDLLRLCSTGMSPATAIQKWKDPGGDPAREYALKRELDSISRLAKEALMAFCIPDRPVSQVEMQDVTGMDSERANSAVADLQRLFLVPKPQIIEDVPRFDLNLNTRLLVRRVMASHNRFPEIQLAYRAASKDYVRSPSRRKHVGEYITQAVALARQSRLEEAEKTLQQGLESYPSDPDLQGQLGWLYKGWLPRRASEALDLFERAAKLHCPTAQMYFHWSELEEWQGSWSKSAIAADAGLAVRPENLSLRYRSGLSRSRIGQNLLKELQPRAIEELQRADQLLQSALKPPDALRGYQERQLQARAYRALAWNYLGLVRSAGDQRDRQRRYADEATQLVQRWVAEHADDPIATDTASRLGPFFSALGSDR